MRCESQQVINQHYLQPEETHLISSSGGLYTPDQVASHILSGLKVCNWVIIFLIPALQGPVTSTKGGQLYPADKSLSSG